MYVTSLAAAVLGALQVVKANSCLSNELLIEKGLAAICSLASGNDANQTQLGELGVCAGGWHHIWVYYLHGMYLHGMFTLCMFGRSLLSEPCPSPFNMTTQNID